MYINRSIEVDVQSITIIFINFLYEDIFFIKNKERYIYFFSFRRILIECLK